MITPCKLCKFDCFCESALSFQISVVNRQIHHFLSDILCNLRVRPSQLLTELLYSGVYFPCFPDLLVFLLHCFIQHLDQVIGSALCLIRFIRILHKHLHLFFLNKLLSFPCYFQLLYLLLSEKLFLILQVHAM